MAHVQKNTKAACGNLFEHYGRASPRDPKEPNARGTARMFVAHGVVSHSLGSAQLDVLQSRERLLQSRACSKSKQKDLPTSDKSFIINLIKKVFRGRQSSLTFGTNLPTVGKLPKKVKNLICNTSIADEVKKFNFKMWSMVKK